MTKEQMETRKRGMLAIYFIGLIGMVASSVMAMSTSKAMTDVELKYLEGQKDLQK